MKMSSVHRPSRPIGAREVSPIGLGCMNLSHAYGARPDETTATRLLNQALDLGVTLLDTATLYGGGENELLLGRAVMHRRREFLLSSKGGLALNQGRRVLDGSPLALIRAVDESLRRLNTDFIDLYYLHRLDRGVPIEESMGALTRAKEAGKIGAIGLSEVSAATIRRAQAVHPLAAIQSEYNPLVRNPEIAVLAACAQHNLAFVAFAPLGRGLLAGAITDDRYPADDMRSSMPRLNQPHLSRNLMAVRRFEALAADKGCTPAQLALAWVLARARRTLAIPGTGNIRHLEENLGALSVTLTFDDCSMIGDLFAGNRTAGPRYPAHMQAQIDTERFAGED